MREGCTDHAIISKGDEMMKEFTYLQDELDTMKQQGTHQTLKEIDSKQSSTVTLNEQSVIQLSSNNYLGLTSHPRLMKAAKEAIDEFGAGTGSVRTIAGTMTMHERLEKSSQLLKRQRQPLYSNQALRPTKGSYPVFSQKMILSFQMS